MQKWMFFQTERQMAGDHKKMIEEFILRPKCVGLVDADSGYEIELDKEEIIEKLRKGEIGGLGLDDINETHFPPSKK